MNMNVQAPSTKVGRFDKVLMKLAAVDEETLRLCPLHDHENVRAVGEIMILTWLYQCALFLSISYRLLEPAGHFRPGMALIAILIATFIATFIMFLDSYMVMRSGWHLAGITELKRGGLDISGGPAARIKAGLFLGIRIALSVGLAQLTAIFVSLLVFSGDIGARIQDKYLAANSSLMSGAAALVDGGIRRATEAVTAQNAHVAALSRQVATLRQNQIDPSASDPQIQQAQQEVSDLVAQKAKADEDVRTAETFAANELSGIKGADGNSGQAGNGPRRRAAIEQAANARRHVQEVTDALTAARVRLAALRKQTPSANEEAKQQAHDQLPTFEETLRAEDAKLASVKNELTNLTTDREGAIQKAIEDAPNHVALESGLLTQIRVLEQIAKENSKIAAVILLIDVISFGFELAAVLAKVTSYVPTKYAALLASNAFMSAVRIADSMLAELNASESKNRAQPEIGPHDRSQDDKNGLGSASELFGGSNGSVPQPPKRPRGRPRKNPPPTVTGANGQEV
jgi:hypothetical protein